MIVLYCHDYCHLHFRQSRGAPGRHDCWQQEVAQATDTFGSGTQTAVPASRLLTHSHRCACCFVNGF